MHRVGLFTALAVSASIAHAGTVRTYFAPFAAGSGGEFRIINLTGNSGLRGTYSDITSAHTWNLSGGDGSTTGYANDDDFQSFCLERNETIQNNRVYSFQISAVSVRGGYGGGNPDPVGTETAWLYSQFRDGSLSNYSYNGVVGSGIWNASQGEARRERAARTLQTAIWFLERELRSTSSGHAVLTNLPTNAPSSNQYSNPNGLNNNEWQQMRSWLAAASSAVTAGYVNTMVKALNLFIDTNGNGIYDSYCDTLAQSQLTLVQPAVPLPSGAGLAMAGLVVGGLRRRRRSRLEAHVR